LHDYPYEEYLYYACAKEFGWTVQETDNQPAHMVDWMLKILKISREVSSGDEQ
jgi:hypothetical protein